jgi:serine phosphatase RsbU (regulator of sigma subunit)
MKKKKVVIVEDEFLISELYRHYLLNLGHEVLATFTNGSDAIAFFRENSADLVLMDVKLGNSEDGIETMKKINEFRDVPVVYISGNTEDDNLKRALDTGLMAFLSKPVAMDDLDNILGSLKEINSSILYAERIQRAIFPQRREISRILPGAIFINRPRHLVNGDFCFIAKNRTRNWIIAGIGDCAGHGVPAALLSVMAHEMLRSLARRNLEPQEIIRHLNRNIVRNLARVDRSRKLNDYLDLLVFRMEVNERKISIADIRVPYVRYIAETGEMEWHQYEGPRIGGGFILPGQIAIRSYTYKEGDYFFFFTDGLPDLAGGEEGKKLRKEGLMELMKKVIAQDPSARDIEFDMMLRKWQGRTMAGDDMILLGFSPSEIEKKQRQDVRTGE